MAKEKYAVIEEKTTHIPEQGHGWPAYTETNQVITTFDSKEEWEAWIDKEMRRDFAKKKFTPIVYREVEVKVNISVDIDN